MSDRHGYGQFCPVAMAAEAVCNRWTVLLLREMLSGSTRFNELRRGLPRMSPALLSKRLRELERLGVCTREADGPGQVPEYRLTEAGEDLRPVVMAMGVWGQRWLESQLEPENLDASLLMWDMRRNLDPAPIARERATVQFDYADARPGQRLWWLVVEPGAVDLCSVDPGHEIDLYVECDLRVMTAIWMGLTTVQAALSTGKLSLHGDTAIARDMQRWLGLSPFAKEKRRISA